jgi:LmbE family N-acetylglucosaminyl deacetylase
MTSVRLRGHPTSFHQPWPLRKLVARRDAFFARSALIVAPHADDETLGCGGTIIRKLAAGARVQVVYMTDSAGLDDGPQLKATRRKEALLACATLGISESDVHFLDFPDGKLSACIAPAAQRLSEILGRFGPEQVFMPYRHDGHADHEASHRAAFDACRDWGAGVAIHEYVVWGLYHWPWYSLPLTRAYARKVLLTNTLKYALGLRVAADYARAFSVEIASVRAQKLQALQSHDSQMTSLSGVGNGEFMTVHLGDHETFRHTRLPRHG